MPVVVRIQINQPAAVSRTSEVLNLQDEGAARPFGGQVSPDDGLASAGRRDEHADVMGEDRVGSPRLDGRQRSVEPDVRWRAGDALIIDIQRDPVLPK